MFLLIRYAGEFLVCMLISSDDWIVVNSFSVYVLSMCATVHLCMNMLVLNFIDLCIIGQNQVI